MTTDEKCDEKMVARHKHTLFSCDALILHGHENLMIAIRIVHAVGLSCSNQLMVFSQNTLAFRPNSAGTFEDLPTNPKSVVGQHGQWPQNHNPINPNHASDSANHVETEKSGVRSHKYLSIYKQEKQVPTLDSESLTTEVRWIVVQTHSWF